MNIKNQSKPQQANVIFLVLTAIALATSSNQLVAAETFNWDGIHVGVNAGYGWNQNNTSCSTPSGIVTPLACGHASSTNHHADVSGFIGGLQLGYSHQFAIAHLGFETDIQGSDINGSNTINKTSLLLGSGTVFKASEQMDLFGTARGVLGVSLSDKTLVYTTGGLAYANVNTHIEDSVAKGNTSTTLTGWVAGAGVGYTLSQHLSTKLEGLFYDLGQIHTIGTFKNPLTLGHSMTEQTFNISGPMVRVGLNYHF